MTEQFSIPQKHELSFRRLVPHLAAPLQNNPEVLSSILIYLKMGGIKLALAAIDALNVNLRIQAVEMMRKKKLREATIKSLAYDDENKDQAKPTADDTVTDENNPTTAVDSKSEGTTL